MAKDFDLVVRGGTIVDGTGSDLREGDVAILDGRIADIGRLSGGGREELDARGMLVTPGFVDLHTHYDAQIGWDKALEPSSWHGVTTVLMGNCGVGFAPCRPENRELLIEIMEGVEDVPKDVLTAGVPFNWETFPQFLDALDQKHTAIDFATQVPHGAVRVFVMGNRAVAREPATSEDMTKMADLVREAVMAGALGFSTSRIGLHRTKKGNLVPHITASEGELRVIAGALRDIGRGVIQAIDDFYDTHEDYSTEFEMWRRIVAGSGRPLSFSINNRFWQPNHWRWLLDFIATANKDGLPISGQFSARATGMLVSLDFPYHPFNMCPTYLAELAHLPLLQRVAEMRKPETKRKLLNEEPDKTRAAREFGSSSGRTWSRQIEGMFELGDPPNYAQPADAKLTERAKRMGISPLELAYDLLLKNEGRGVLLNAVSNSNEEVLLAMLKHPNAVVGGGDAGAHLGFVCDGSSTTSVLTFWTRDRKGEKLPIPSAVKMITEETARAIGLNDRGVIRRGYRADLNVIDYDKLTLHAPFPLSDLPGGGCRLTQRADGYIATIVNGTTIRREGNSTGKYPGRLIRGPQASPN